MLPRYGFKGEARIHAAVEKEFLQEPASFEKEQDGIDVFGLGEWS